MDTEKGYGKSYDMISIWHNCLNWDWVFLNVQILVIHIFDSYTIQPIGPMIWISVQLSVALIGWYDYTNQFYSWFGLLSSLSM